MGNILLTDSSFAKQKTGGFWLIKKLFFFLLLFLTAFVGKAQFSVANIDGNPQEWSISNINSIPIHAYVLDPFGTGVIDNQFTSSKDFYLCPGTGNDRIQWVEG
ncbi:MAG TPA: hypothetical protein VFN30_00080, partial [Chitinophagaceae bacterium]|nr:hypothetical protein [Chitinophagaceae bacterium]